MRKILAEERIAKIFNVLAIIVFIPLFVLSLCISWINDWDLVREYVSPVKDSLIGNLFYVVIILLVAGLWYHFAKRSNKKVNMDIIATMVSILVLLFGIYWVGATNTTVQADQYIICHLAEAFEFGDFSGLNQDEYLGSYPQQLGIITFLRLLYKMFGEEHYKAFQYFNALMASVFVLSGYHVVKHLSKDSKLAEAFYLILMILCVPFYCYIPFVYGEISSTALVMLAGWLYLSCLERFSWPKVIFMSFVMGAAIQFRKNTLIFLIAFVIVSIVKLLQKPDKHVLISIGGILLSVILFQSAINYTYKDVTPEGNNEIPAILFVVMGTNEDNGMAGWHNFYEMWTFAEYNYHVEAATAIGLRDLKVFLLKCLDDPAYAVDFYYRKISSQWNVPMYQCLAMNNKIAGEQSPLAESVYFGSLREFAEAEMNIYQIMVYGGVLGLLLLIRKKWCHIENYLLLIGIFGGFLFSIIWEAKSRYVFPYFIMMIPYAAVGIYECVKWLYGKYEVIRHNNKGEAVLEESA